jgi:hypothetical protein
VAFSQEDPIILKNAIDWFNNLREEEQSLLIAKLGDLEYNFTPEQTNKLTIMTLAVMNSLNTTSKDQTVNTFIRFGMNQVYARLLVDKITTQAALSQLDSKSLNSLDDSQFSKAIETVVVKTFVENNNIQQLLEFSGLAAEQFQAALRFIRDNTLFTYLRGEITKENLKSLLTERAKFSEGRANLVIDLLDKHRSTMTQNFMFRHTQDTLFRLLRLEQIQMEILNQLKELVTHIKKTSGSDQQQGQPSLYR